MSVLEFTANKSGIVYSLPRILASIVETKLQAITILYKRSPLKHPAIHSVVCETETATASNVVLRGESGLQIFGTSTVTRYQTLRELLHCPQHLQNYI